MRTYRWLPVPLLALTLSAAHADTPLPATAREDAARTQLLSKTLPIPRADQDREPVPESSDAFRLHMDKGTGLELRKPTRIADRDLVFGIKGPLMKRNRLGLVFEVRF
jgi:hypothetical protein